MESQLLNELFSTIDTKVFNIVLQLIIVGAIVMWVKDMNGRVVNYLKLKMSDFGRGTKVKVAGYEGYIHSIGFNEVEILVDGDQTLLVPVDVFIRSTKVIITKRDV
jgi:hypothetical protein